MSKYSIRTLQTFEKCAKRLKKKYPSLASDLFHLIQTLEDNPMQGTSLGKGCYKVRMLSVANDRGNQVERD